MQGLDIGGIVVGKRGDTGTTGPTTPRPKEIKKADDDCCVSSQDSLGNITFEDNQDPRE